MVSQGRGHAKFELAQTPKLSLLIPRSRTCRCFFVFHALFFFSVYNVMMLTPSEQHVSTFSTSAASKSHLANSLSPYTTLQMVNRGVARENYLNATGPGDMNRARAVMRHFVHDYIDFHKKNRHTNARRLVFSPSGTGIGDRFRCMLFAYWAAVVSNRIFLVSWNDPFPLQEFMVEGEPGLKLNYNYTSDKPELIKGPRGQMVPDTLNITGADLDRFERVMASRIHTVFINTNKVPRAISDEFLSMHMPPDLTVRIMNSVRSDSNLFRAILHHVFKLSDEMVKTVQALSEEMELKGVHEKQTDGWFRHYYSKAFRKRRRPYIGVHARLGRGIGEGMSRFEKISANLGIAAKCLASRAVRLSVMAGTPSLPIYLATDTAEFRDVFKEIVNEISHGRIDVVSGKWNVVHSNRLNNRRHKNGTKVDTGENRNVMWSTFVDLVMLGYAEHILALYSSFPRLAAYLGDAESITELRNEICLSGERW